MADLVALTNAILVASLPYFDDFAQKLQLPVKTPIRLEDLAHFYVEPEKISSYIVLRSGPELWFSQGHVEAFRLPSSYYNLQDPNLVPKFYGTFKLSRDECEGIVVRAVERLGYTNLFSQLPPPKVKSPPPDFGHAIPRFLFYWPFADDETIPAVEAEVDAERGRIHKLNLLGRWFRRPPPKLSLPLPPKPRMTRPEVLVPEGAQELSEAHREAMVRSIWPEVVKFLEAVGAPTPSGPPNKELDLGRTKCFMLRDRLGCRLAFNNGFTVQYHRGRIIGVFAPDGYFTDDYLNYTKLEEDDFATDLKFRLDELAQRARRILVDKLGLNEKDNYLDKPVIPRAGPGNRKYGLRRWLLDWGPPISQAELDLEQETGLFREPVISMEMDALTGEIKYLSLRCAKMPDKPDPKLDLQEGKAATAH